MGIAILGDIHFTSRKKYFTDVCYYFLDWYLNWPTNNNNNSLILAGDLVDSHVNGGIVIDLLEKFIPGITRLFFTYKICTDIIRKVGYVCPA